MGTIYFQWEHLLSKSTKPIHQHNINRRNIFINAELGVIATLQKDLLPLPSISRSPSVGLLN